MLAHGYRRFLPTKDHIFILDYAGTLFFLKNALVSSTLGQIQWKRACRYVVLCRGAKDVSSRSPTTETPPLFPVPRAHTSPEASSSGEPPSLTRNGKPSLHFPSQVSHLPHQDPAAPASSTAGPRIPDPFVFSYSLPRTQDVTPFTVNTSTCWPLGSSREWWALPAAGPATVSRSTCSPVGSGSSR